MARKSMSEAMTKVRAYFKNMFTSIGKTPAFKKENINKGLSILLLILIMPFLILARIIKLVFIIVGVVLVIALIIVFIPFILIYKLLNMGKKKPKNPMQEFFSNHAESSVIEGTFKEEEVKEIEE